MHTKHTQTHILQSFLDKTKRNADINAKNVVERVPDSVD